MTHNAPNDWFWNVCLPQSRYHRVSQAVENKTRLLDPQLWQETLIAPAAQVAPVAAIGAVAVVREQTRASPPTINEVEEAKADQLWMERHLAPTCPRFDALSVVAFIRDVQEPDIPVLLNIGNIELADFI